MPDIDARFGQAVASLARAARELSPERFLDLLEDVAVETAAALAAERAGRMAVAKRSGSRVQGGGNVVPFGPRRGKRGNPT